MKKFFLISLFLGLGIAASVFADELDALVYKQRGVAPAPESLVAAPAEKPRDSAVVTPSASVEKPGVEAISPTPAPAEKPSVEAVVPTPVPAEKPSDSAIPQVAIPAEPPTSKNEFIFPAGSSPSRSSDNSLVIASPQGESKTFSAGSRAFRLQDGTLKVFVPETPTPAVVLQSPNSDSVVPLASATTISPTPLPTEPGLVSSEAASRRSDATVILASKAIDEGNDTGFYVAMRGMGLSMTPKVDGEKQDDYALDSFVGGSLAFGYRCNDNFRMEIEGLGAGASEEEVSATVAVGFANVIFSIPLGSQASFFVGGGAGVLVFEEDFEYTEYYYTTSYYYSWYSGYHYYQTEHSYTEEGSGKATLPALNAMGGFSLNLSQSISLDLAFRYLMTLEGQYTSDEVGDADLQLDFVGGYVGLSFLY